MKIYIAGKITGLKNYKFNFLKAEKTLNEKGHICMNPCHMQPGFTQEEYLRVCFAMIEVCDTVYMLNNWKDSPGATKEYNYAKSLGKKIIFE